MAPALVHYLRRRPNRLKGNTMTAHESGAAEPIASAGAAPSITGKNSIGLVHKLKRDHDSFSRPVFVVNDTKRRRTTEVLIRDFYQNERQ